MLSVVAIRQEWERGSGRGGSEIREEGKRERRRGEAREETRGSEQRGSYRGGRTRRPQEGGK